jgi:hypothetical protein
MKSDAPSVDESGGQYSAHVTLFEPSEGQIGSPDIDISGASVTLERSTDGGSFSTTSVTQPTLSKADGVVEVVFDIAGSEWTVGDTYRLTIDGVEANDSDGNTFNIPTVRWVGSTNRDSGVQSKVSILHNTRVPDILSLSNIQDEAEDALLADLSSNSPDSSSVVDVTSTLESRLPGSGTLSTHAWDPDGVIPSAGTVAVATDLDPVERRQPPDAGSITLSDDTDNGLIALGSVGRSVTHYLDALYADVTLGDHTQVTFKLTVDVNGNKAQVNTLTVSSSGPVDVLSDAGWEVPASALVEVDVAGDAANPSTNGNVDFSAEHSQAE